MKKLLTVLLAALLTAGAAISASAVEQSDPVAISTDDYPGSVIMYDLAEPANSEIMIGTFYRLGSCFGDGYTEATVVDGDYTTYFAPVNDDFTPQNQLIMKMDEPYTVSEIRFFGRDEKFERTMSLCFDASNDGENWTTLYETQDIQDAEEYSYVIIPASDFDYNGGFTYFRVHQVDPGMPLNLAEVEWWGAKTDAAADAPADERADGTDMDAEPYVEPTYTYPASGLEGVIINGTVIGLENGYDGTPATGAASAFDGNPKTFLDPIAVGDGFCGMDAGEAVVLDKVAILSRKDWADRFAGAMIQGSNDGENWTTLWTSDAAAASTDEYTVITADMMENNTGFSQYRYFNETNHGDVAEVEFYKVGEPEVTYTYPASGAGDNIIAGTIIGNELGWGDSAEAGAAAAFDGNPATFFDPLGVGDGFCGMEASESMILDKAAILSRAGQEARFVGAMIQGSNDGENWTTLWTSDAEGSNAEYAIITEFENNTGYTQFRYFNETNHGDVAEVEFYGAAGKIEEAPAEEAAPVEEVVEEVVEEAAPAEEVEEVVEEAPAAEEAAEEAPQTFDAAIIAAVAAIVSAAGYAISRKH